MKKLQFFLGVLSMLISSSLLAQNLAHHRWENRISLVFTDDFKNPLYVKQIKHWQAFEQGMKERKLRVYHIARSDLKEGIKLMQRLKKSSTWDTLKKTKKTFEIQLIGLDGGVKRVKNEFLDTQELFAIIDAMPMRKAELQRQE